MKHKYPKEVTILGVTYKIKYVNHPSEVDSEKRRVYFGETDPWDKTIRIYKGDRSVHDIYCTLFHEVVHVIKTTLYLTTSDIEDIEERDVDLIAKSMLDFCIKSKLDFSHFKEVEKKIK